MSAHYFILLFSIFFPPQQLNTEGTFIFLNGLCVVEGQCVLTLFFVVIIFRHEAVILSVMNLTVRKKASYAQTGSLSKS